MKTELNSDKTEHTLVSKLSAQSNAMAERSNASKRKKKVDNVATLIGGINSPSGVTLAGITASV